MDELDLRITDLLQRAGRTSNADLARELGVSEGTIRRRVGRLIQEDDEGRNDDQDGQEGWFTTEIVVLLEIPGIDRHRKTRLRCRRLRWANNEA